LRKEEEERFLEPLYQKTEEEMCIMAKDIKKPMSSILVESFIQRPYIIYSGGMAGERSFLGENIQKRR